MYGERGNYISLVGICDKDFDTKTYNALSFLVDKDLVCPSKIGYNSLSKNEANAIRNRIKSTTRLKYPGRVRVVMCGFKGLEHPESEKKVKKGDTMKVMFSTNLYSSSGKYHNTKAFFNYSKITKVDE